MDCPAFILGNSPRLPVDDLECLSGLFTIGVNRILESGFAPTVVLWVDRSVYEDCEAEIERSGALLVCDSHLACRQHHLGIKAMVGNEALGEKPRSTELHINGNTGCCAARWAVGLGCWPVYLVGMEARYKMDKTDFYGVNKHHHGEGKTLGVMSSELQRLLFECGDTVKLISGGKLLRKIAQSCRELEQEELRETIRRLV